MYNFMGQAGKKKDITGIHAVFFWQEWRFKPAGNAARPHSAPHFCTPGKAGWRSTPAR